MRKMLLIEKKIYRQRAKRNKWKKLENQKKNSQRKSERRAKQKRGRTDKPKEITVPVVFSMQENINEVVQFFQSITNLYKLNIRSVFFDFKKVEKISNGAITILLSHIGWLKDKGIDSIGCYPENADAKDFFVKSGFLDFFKTIGLRKYEKTQNAIIARGQVHIDAELTAKFVRQVSKTVWGFNEKNQKLQGMLIELMANTVNHAYIKSKHQRGWYFSVNHISEESRVKFCFVDNGAGILNTIHKKFGEKISSLIGITNDKDVLQRAFDGEFGSRTRLSNRGRGLKAVKKTFESGHIKNLKVLTNNILYDFDKKESIEITENFHGTFYFWEIDKTCNT